MESSSSPVRLYVGCLPASVTRATIEKHFGTFGNISEIIVKGPSSGDNRVYSLKYAFFTAANESVARAILDASPHTIDGSGLKPERAHKPRVREGVADRMLAERSLTQGCKLFVGGLTNNTTKEDLHAYFSQFGELTDFVIMNELKSSRSRGFGFVTFKDEASVARVTPERYHYIKSRWVEVKPAVPRAEMDKYDPDGDDEAADSVPRGLEGFSQMGIGVGAAGLESGPPAEWAATGAQLPSPAYGWPVQTGQPMGYIQGFVPSEMGGGPVYGYAPHIPPAGAMYGMPIMGMPHAPCAPYPAPPVHAIAYAPPYAGALYGTAPGPYQMGYVEPPRTHAAPSAAVM